MHSTKNKLLSLLCFLCMLLSLFAVLPASSFAVSVENPIKSWDLIPELHSGNNLNDSAYTGRCSVWQINVEKGGTTGDFMRMTFTNDGYVDASGEDLTHAKFSSSSKDGYVSPGRNGATGKEAHVAYGFTVPETGTYVLEVQFTTYPSWGADWTPQADSAPYFYTMVRSENVAENDVELKKQSEFTFDVNGSASQTNQVTVQLKAGETVYYVSAANGEALHDKGYYRAFNVYLISYDYTEPEEEEVVTPPPALGTDWNLGDYNAAHTNLNSDTSTAPMSIWQINYNEGDTVGTFMKMNFNGTVKYSDASDKSISGLCLEDMHFCPGRNGTSKIEADIAISFTAPTTGTYSLAVKMNRPSYLGTLKADYLPRFFTTVGQNGEEENVFEYTDTTGASMTKNIEFQLKAGETLYFVNDIRGQRSGRELDVMLSTFKVTLKSLGVTEGGDDNTGDNTNQGNESDVNDNLVDNATVGQYWNLGDFNAMSSNLNSSTSAAPLSVWQINFDQGATVGTFMKMTFNGSKKYADASGNNLSGLCLEDMHLCPGRNGASGKEGDAAIAFTAPSTGTYTLVVTMDHPSYLGALDATSYPRFYTMLTQAGAEENVFEYTGASLTKTIEVQLKAGETFYFASDARGSRVAREHDVRLATFKVTYTSTNYTVNEDTEPDIDDNSNPGTSDYVCSVAVLAAVCGVGVLAKKKKHRTDNTNPYAILWRKL